jgi:predicted DsbA family dithiol-disulfide isomerase
MAESEIMQVQVDVWSDYVCPFCYLEQPVLERIAQEYGARSLSAPSSGATDPGNNL